MSSLRTAGPAADRLRIVAFRGDPAVALLVPVPERGPLLGVAVADLVARLRSGGVRTAYTAALGAGEQRPFLENGFVVHEHLHLLAHELFDVPATMRPPASIRRARRADRGAVLTVDSHAFDTPFWRLDERGLLDALAATPTARFRVATVGREVVGYAISGRAGPRGYIQRLAVDPAVAHRGIGRALLVDGLRWLQRRGADRALVNTQLGNDTALALYQSVGFRVQREGLAVLHRDLAAGE